MAVHSDKKFDLKIFMTCGVFGVLTFVFNFIIGSTIIPLSGIPGTGSITSMIVAGFFFTIPFLMYKRIGIILIVIVVYSVLCIPTVLLGPPGIVKIGVALLTGLLWDIIFYSLRRTTLLSALSAAFISGIFVVVLIYIEIWLLGLPAAGKLVKILWWLAPASGIGGSFGAWLACSVYNNRLAKLQVIKRLLP